MAGVKPLAQQIPITCALQPLDPAASARYIQARLALAGRADPLFQEEALAVIFRNSGGIPRRINTLCDVSLALGSAQKAERIGAGLVLEAAEKFGLV